MTGTLTKKSIEQCLKTVFYLVLPSFLIPYLSLSYSHFEMDLLPCSAALFDKAVLGLSEDVLWHMNLGILFGP